MALGKWRFGSSRGRSIASSNDSEPSTQTTTPTESTTELSNSYSSSNSSNISKTSSSTVPSSPRRSWFRSNQPKKAISSNDPAFSRLHKPFTEQNLEHQKMLNAFEWNFGRQRRSSTSSWISSVSPCASRSASIDFGDGSDYDRDDMLPPNSTKST